jgi:hypothetical protein
MANTLHDDILVPEGTATRPRQTPLGAFVPIAVALFGIAAILAGGISARDVAVADGNAGVDPVTTGSVATAPAPAPVRPERWE